jgi:hypothetical protein
MTWERALEADARLAARNALLIRAALQQSFDAERAYQGYLNTTPDTSLTLPQQRVRARSWAIMNIRVNLEPLKEVIYRMWAQAYALGDTAAREAIFEAKEAQKADAQGIVDWSKWKPGDAVSALLLKPPRAFQQLLQSQGITFKGFSDTTLTDIGNAIGEAITLGLDAKASAKLIRNHVASPARALTIAITEQNRAISQATVNRYREAGLQQQEWLVFEPCKICAENANQKVNIGTPFPSGDLQPPAHPHCRCALAPVIPGFDDPANTAGSMTSPSITPEGDVAIPPPVDYRGHHQAPTRADGFGAPAYKIDEEMMPDFYERPNIYTTGMPVADKESVQALISIRNKPEALVTVYRAVPEGVNTINPGDWVTMSRSYADTHLLSNLEEGRVISMQVRAKDLWFDGNSINEFGYDPLSKPLVTTAISDEALNIVTNKAKVSDYKTWKKEQLLSFTKTKQGLAVKKEVYNGATDTYIPVYAALEDNTLKTILKEQDFMVKPTLVSAEDIEKLSATNTKIYRGVNDFENKKAIDFVNEFKTGDMFVGRGVIGNGVYAGKNYEYVIKYAKDKPENVITMVLKPDAKVIDFAEAENKAKNAQKAFWEKASGKEVFISISGLEDYMKNFDGLTPDELRDIGNLFNDVGRYAALNGYDAIRYADPDGDVYVLLNRGAVAVQK